MSYDPYGANVIRIDNNGCCGEPKDPVLSTHTIHKEHPFVFDHDVVMVFTHDKVFFRWVQSSEYFRVDKRATGIPFFDMIRSIGTPANYILSENNVQVCLLKRHNENKVQRVPLLYGLYGGSNE